MARLIRRVLCAREKVVPSNKIKLLRTEILEVAQMFRVPVIRVRIKSRTLGGRAAKGAAKALCKLRLEERV